ncbi:hypothetical protein KAW18_18505 [candidate division WOR-3 bacterium]|nr:hypothetical protein [candidate division WOR-3 bacterium]
MKIFNNWKQWIANRGATIEYKGYIEAVLVQHDLARLNTKLTGRIDALETYVEDVVEKYLKKMNTREARAKEKEMPVIVEPLSTFETIRQKYGGKE